MTQFQCPAIYFDGRHPGRHVVALDLSGGRIALNGAAPRSYAFEQARLAEPFANTPCVLEFDDGARLEVRERAALPALQRALGYRPSRIERWQQHWYAALLALLLLIGSVVAAVKWGIPALADQVVAALPASLDQRVGDDALTTLLDEEEVMSESRLSDQRLAEVQAAFQMVRPASARMPLKLIVVDMGPSFPANAFALPNGTIAMNDAMVRLIVGGADGFNETRTAQLAGVLAHEIGHVEGRHGMRALARGSLMAFGSAALFGDFSAVAAGLPVLLLNLDYSRTMERAADDYAIARLHALRLPASPMADLFAAMERDQPAAGPLAKWVGNHSAYLSSHPSNAERMAHLRQSDR